MAQGLFGGCTSYEVQSLNSIIKDVENWKSYSQIINRELKERVEKAKENKFWEKVGFDFKMTIISTINYTENMLYDFDMIINACRLDELTEREVTLLYNIGKNAHEFNRQYPRDFKGDNRWHDYGNKDFENIEKMYQDGRDFFVTLLDATNAANRLKDYINKKIVNKSIYISQSGDNCQAVGLNNGTVISNIYNNQQISNEIKSAIEKIEESKELDLECKNQIKDILTETESAIISNDKNKQNFCKKMFNIFKSGGGSKVIETINILSSFITIGSFFGLLS